MQWTELCVSSEEPDVVIRGRPNALRGPGVCARRAVLCGGLAVVVSVVMAAAQEASQQKPATREPVTRTTTSDRRILDLYLKNEKGDFPGLFGLLLEKAGFQMRTPHTKAWVLPEGQADPVEAVQLAGLNAPLVLSQDLLHYAFVVPGSSLDSRVRVAVDGLVREDRFLWAVLWDFVPDGAEVDYAGGTRGWRLYMDGKEVGRYHDVMGRIFSSDGRHSCYGFRKKDTWTLVKDGQTILTRYKSISYRAYTPTDQLAIGGKVGDRWLVELGGTEYPQDAEAVLVLGRGERRPPMVVQRADDKTHYVALDGRRMGPYESVGPAASDERSGVVTFAAKTKAGSVIYVEGEERGPYSDHRWVAIRRVAGLAGEWAYGAKVDDRFRLFTASGARGSWEDMVGPFSLSPFGIVWAYKTGGGWMVATPHEEWGPYEDLGRDWPLWQTSPDGRHLAFVVKSGGRWSLAVDGREGELKGTGVRALRWVGQSSLRYWLARETTERIRKDAQEAAAYSVIEERVE